MAEEERTLQEELQEEYASWPIEIRQLFDAALQAWASGDAAVEERVEHLMGLADQRTDPVVARAARDAVMWLFLRWDPERFGATLQAAVRKLPPGGRA